MDVTMTRVDRRLGSAIQGMVCKMIDRVAEDDAMEMAQIMTENPQWLSRAQVHARTHATTHRVTRSKLFI